MRVVRNEQPLGPSLARNSGLAAARARWIAFLDDDDVWAPERLRAGLEALGRDGRASWVCTGAIVVDERLRPIGAQRPPGPDALPGAVLRYNAVPGGASGVLASTGLVRRAGGFDPGLRILADWDLWIRLALRSPAVSVDRPLVGYVLHGANMTMAPAGFPAELERIRETYRTERAALGVELDEAGWIDWFAELDRRAGRRLAPAWRLARAAVRERSARRAQRAASLALRPGWARRRDRWRLEHMEPAWRREAEAWLADLAADGSSGPP